MANLRVDKITSTETFETTGSVQFGNDNALKIAANSGFDLTSNDFTMEAWVYLASVESFQTLLMYTVDGTEDDTSFQFDITSTQLRFVGYVSNSSVVKGTNFSFESSTWYHVAATRTNDLIRLFVDGNLIGTHGFTSTIDTEGSAELNIGYRNNNGTMDREVLGHLSNVRIVNGVALYTSNFKPSMKELEVVPGTVLLACQSKTDASLEKTGKTITVNGTAVANELTPGLLTPIVKSGGGSAITGSVEFDGTGDYLSLAANSDFNFGSDNFTIEGFFYKGGATTNQTLLCSDKYYIAGNNGNWILRITSGTQIAFASYNGTGSEEYTEFSAKSDDGGWHHFAFVREGTGSNQSKFYFDGVHRGSMTVSKSLTDAGTNGLRIGEESDSGPGNNFMNGFLSNIRINKGTALYTADFIPPTRELKKVPGTVLLCCQDENSVTTEVTGKTITSNGDPAPSNFTPQVGDDRQITFEGVTKINTDAYFYLPTGDTITRNSRSGRGIIFSIGATTSYFGNATTKGIQYWHIPSGGIGLDFGELVTLRESPSVFSSSTRGFAAGGANYEVDPATFTNSIEFITLSSTGNGVDFGDLNGPRVGGMGLSDSTRGIVGGGINSPASPGYQVSIDYVTMASTGNAIDFGDFSSHSGSPLSHRERGASFASPTKGIFAGGKASPAFQNTIEYITIASKGDTINFGDLWDQLDVPTGCSSSTRGIIAGGTTPTYQNAISYITMASTGNTKDFGDLSDTQSGRTSMSNSIRGVFDGGYAPNNPIATRFPNTIEFINIASTGNAINFGEMGAGRGYGTGSGNCSDSHGSLG